MRFDDTLDTVLAADLSTPLGRQSVYRQLVDLIGRRRVPAAARAIETLEAIAPAVPLAHRTAAARGLAFAQPPFELVRLFARDTLAVAAPVLRTATLEPGEWQRLLGELAPPARAILRHRRDLGSEVERALAAFGSTDFVLADDRVGGADAVVPSPAPVVLDPPMAEPLEAEPVTPPPVRAVPSVPSTFASLGSVALTLPVVAEAVRRAEIQPAPPPAEPVPDGPFRIADVVARIDAFRDARERARPHANDGPPPAGEARMRFETDAEGVVRWADGTGRAALIGLSLRLAGGGAMARVDGVAAGAFRQRARFRDARLRIDGNGPAAGDWLMSAMPAFDPASGRFTGYQGTARRPHPGELAAPAAPAAPAPDALRQLVHELRTPTNAIIGFSEMISLQMLGPVADVYRDRAGAIHRHARDLLGAIDDLDLAAKIESDALTLRPEAVSLRAVLGSVAHDLAPLAELRGAAIALPERDAAVEGDRHAIERLFGRLIATLLAATTRGETLAMAIEEAGERRVLTITRPAGLPDRVEAGGEVSEEEDAAFAALPLGTGFALRLADNLAHELGGEIGFGDAAIRVSLPAAGGGTGRAATNS
ncbi:histidine kinase [Sphingomonas spermidinifaciens]|uniref:histidine kinase n=1 Tax=Sphingomonas spermidinifaciens TaxID=1141889 RepID=A0A2A4BAL8_9SPHN|nr:HAMP domain-containing sensor histidine kinase [Sphingomonas spermidinifaciens]PCD04674.1 histidine kinase [Sphingomonas spermidinifaciens]